ncbi:helicase-related protein [Thalassobaculum fulvum]|uniref:helicase-related protein n=1 Tax=Thalassobaculum fulvum TaxID=1633335 RepID=UPI001E3AE3D7|nr:helicase-related protein [Thalassobaculum fulvum]
MPAPLRPGILAAMVHAELPSLVTAVLGPTNTGKTHLAIERLLGHESGMIGFPLRLLARENYDRVVAAKGPRAVALITGEEKIVPPEARYFICTVESMPLDREVAFLAVDEIQLAGDPERGHVFTDRLLHARGAEETMFLGADTIRPLLQRLVPEARVETRPRLSRLEYVGPCKITRLPRRSAVVAFSAADVYALAEVIRRQRGGAAVVMGALSPRTRNAQVRLFQEGEVDYLVATDAIGMGLNMDVDHVAFAEDSKFDGRVPRKLTPPELAQIAGRAGRHMNDGTFGVTMDCRPFADEVVAAIEEHRFEPVRQLHWRNSALSFATVRDLKRTLEERAPQDFLIRKRDADDQRALDALARMPEVMDRTTAPARVRLLWDVCQIPDFQKTMSEAHARLLAQVFAHLTEGSERLPSAWVDEQMGRFDRTDGDIDTLAARIAHVRTWTYITNRADWIDDPVDRQARARAIEDRLSDALHDRLTQRFVDRRAATLSRRLKDEDADLIAAVAADGTVLVEGHRVGHLEGLSFVPEATDAADAKAVLATARRVLPAEIARRVARIEACDDAAIALDDRGRFLWEGSAFARLVAGDAVWRPEIRISRNELLEPPLRDRLLARARAWFESHQEAVAPRLVQLQRADLDGPARGIAFQVLEGLGGASAPAVETLVKDLDDDGRKTLARVGIRLGTESLYVPELLKPRAVRLRSLLWSAASGRYPEEGPPPEGRVQVVRAEATPAAYDAALGYARLGGRAVRVDMVERLAALVRRAGREGPFAITPEMLSLAGVDAETFGRMLLDLGCRPAAAAEDGTPRFERRRNRPKPKPEQSERRRRRRRPKGETAAAPRPAAPAAAAEPTAEPVPVPGEAAAGEPAVAHPPAGPPDGDAKPERQRQRPRRRKGGPKPTGAAQPPRQPTYDPNSPFAVLAKLRFGNSGR